MRSKTLAATAAATLAGTVVAMVPSSAHASCDSENKFCGWKDSQYSNTRLIYDSSPAGSRQIFVSQQDQMSSGKNFTNNKWCGVNQVSFAPDYTLVAWSAGDMIANLQNIPNANDNIDYFDVTGNNTSCPRSF
jgi:hypothetical protein